MSRQNLITFSTGAVEEGTLLVTRLSGHEGMSQLFQFELELMSQQSNVDLKAVLSSHATLGIRQGVQLAGSESRGTRLVQLHGMVSSIRQLDKLNDWISYHVTFVPRMWALSRHRVSQVYIEKSIPAIVAENLKDAGLEEDADFEFRLTGDYRVRDYVVQYDETDLAFVSRWLEHEGIFWFFEHSESGEKIVFADSTSAYGHLVGGGANLNYRPRSRGSQRAEVRDAAADDWFAEEVISGFGAGMEPLPKSITLKDYNWRNPDDKLQCEETVDADGLGGFWHYNAHYRTGDEGAALAAIRAEEYRCREYVFEGHSDCRSFRAGATFSLSEHYRPDFNAEMVLTDVHHDAAISISFETGQSTGGSYSNTFNAIPSDRVFRPRRVTPWPAIRGVLHATVDSSKDDTSKPDINADGCYLLKLPWDVAGKDKPAGRASRYVRMAQPYVGNDYGSHYPLHPGTEVLLVHIDGNPDRPVIAGAVPNRNTVSPVTSGNSNKNIQRSSSGNTIEMDDTPGQEGLTMANGGMTGVMSFRTEGAGGGGGAGGFGTGAAKSPNAIGSGMGASFGGSAAIDALVTNAGLTGARATSALPGARVGIFSGPLAHDSWNDALPMDSTGGVSATDDSNVAGDETATAETLFLTSNSASISAGFDFTTAYKQVSSGAENSCVSSTVAGSDNRSSAGVFSGALNKYDYTIGYDVEVIDGDKGMHVNGSLVEYIKGDRTDRYNEVVTENTELRCSAGTNLKLLVGMHDTGGDQVSRPSAAECLAVGRIFNVTDTHKYIDNLNNTNEDAVDAVDSGLGDADRTYELIDVSYNADCSKLKDNEVREYTRARIVTGTTDLTGSKDTDAGSDYTTRASGSSQGLATHDMKTDWQKANYPDGYSAPDSKAKEGEARDVVFADRVSEYTYCKTGDGTIASVTHADLVTDYVKADYIREINDCTDYVGKKYGAAFEYWCAEFCEVFIGLHSSFRIAASLEVDLAIQTDIWLLQKTDIAVGMYYDIGWGIKVDANAMEEFEFTGTKAGIVATLLNTLTPMGIIMAGMLKLGA